MVKASSSVLCSQAGSPASLYRVEEQGWLSHVLQVVRDRDSFHKIMILWAAFLTDRGGEGWQCVGVTFVTVSPKGRLVAGSALLQSHPQGWLTHPPVTRAISLCCLGKAQNSLSWVLLLVRDGTSSPECQSLSGTRSVMHSPWTFM